jgi:hypothetical protein
MKDELFTTSGNNSRLKAWADRMTYRPIKGGPRGYAYRLPVVGKKLMEKALNTKK